MKYDILPELRKYRFVTMPANPFMLQMANKMMPLVQKESSPYEKELEIKEISFPTFSAQLIRPLKNQKNRCLVYYHGGAFAMKAAKYHKNLVREYAYRAGISVLFVDYRLSPEYAFPIPVNDCMCAYQWALEHYESVFVGGDSAGGALALSIALQAKEKAMKKPDRLFLIHPVVSSKMDTRSMQEYVDTPLWNAKQNRKMWEMYANPEDWTNPYASPVYAENYIGFPETYIELADYDCLKDEGYELYTRLCQDGVNAEVFQTKHTIHGFDIEEKSSYVKNCVNRRICFLQR